MESYNIKLYGVPGTTIYICDDLFGNTGLTSILGIYNSHNILLDGITFDGNGLAQAGHGKGKGIQTEIYRVI